MEPTISSRRGRAFALVVTVTVSLNVASTPMMAPIAYVCASSANAIWSMWGGSGVSLRTRLPMNRAAVLPTVSWIWVASVALAGK